MRRPELFFKIEAIAVIGKRAAMNLEDQWILFRSVEIRRLDDPALNFAMIFGGFVPDLFDVTERSSRKKALVYLGQDLRPRGLLDANGDFPRQIRSRMCQGKSASFRDGKRGNTAGSARRRPDVTGQHPYMPLEIDEIKARVAMDGGGEINAVAVRRPPRRLNVVIDRAGKKLAVAAVPIHDVKLAELITLVAVIEADIGDLFAVGRNFRVAIGAFTRGQWPDRAVSTPNSYTSVLRGSLSKSG